VKPNDCACQAEENRLGIRSDITNNKSEDWKLKSRERNADLFDRANSDNKRDGKNANI
jgi:hypothetical protein